MELISKNRPNKYLIRIVVIIVLAVLVNLIFSFDFVIWVVLLTLILLLFLSQKYTVKIVQDASSLKVEYMRFLRKETLNVPLYRLSVKLNSNASLRSAKYYILEIYDAKKKVYEVDSRDGFDERQFINFADNIISILS